MINFTCTDAICLQHSLLYQPCSVLFSCSLLADVDMEEDDLLLLSVMSSVDEPSSNDSASESAQSNHIGEVNGDIDDLLENKASENSLTVNTNTATALSACESAHVRRLSSASASSVVSPVNGIKPYDHNAALVRHAVKLVKRPGKGE